MVQAKTELFDAGLSRQANLFKALSHPARLQILLFLAKANTCISGDISDDLPLSRTTVNQHLKELKRAGLVHGTVEGVKTNYCLNPEGIALLDGLLSDFVGSLKQTTISCCK